MAGRWARSGVGAIGASHVDRAWLEEAGVSALSVVQNSYSLLDREPEIEVLPICVEHGIVFSVFGPLAGGWLTGKYRRGEQPPPGSRMRSSVGSRSMTRAATTPM